MTGEPRKLFQYSGPTGDALNVLALSRDLPDPRGGRGGAGAVPHIVAATRAIKLSSQRVAAEWQ